MGGLGNTCYSHDCVLRDYRIQRESCHIVIQEEFLIKMTPNLAFSREGSLRASSWRKTGSDLELSWERIH